MKFNPKTLIDLLEQCGFELVRRERDLLVVRPAHRLTEEMIDAIRRHKPDLLPHLKEAA